MLTRHKAVELELQTYDGLVKKLGREADKLSKMDKQEGMEIIAKQVSIPSLSEVWYNCIQIMGTRVGLFYVTFLILSAMLQTDLEKQLERLRKECEERRYRLEEAKNLFEYLREAEDLEQFIEEQVQIASSEDYGQDFEHLQVRKMNGQ